MSKSVEVITESAYDYFSSKPKEHVSTSVIFLSSKMKVKKIWK